MSNSEKPTITYAPGPRENGEKTAVDAILIKKGERAQTDQPTPEKARKTPKIIRKIGVAALMATAAAGALFVAGKGDKEALEAENRARVEAESQNYGAKLDFNIHSDPNTNVISGELVAPNGQVYHYEGAPGTTEEDVKNSLTRMMDNDNQGAAERSTVEY